MCEKEGTDMTHRESLKLTFWAFVLAVTVRTLLVASAPSIVGDWKGVLDAGGTSMHVVVHVARQPDGTFSGTLDSPDQGVSGIVMSAVTFVDPDVHFTIERIASHYDGRINQADSEIVGTWKQGGGSLPLTL